MLTEPKGFNTWVDLSRHQFNITKMDCWQVLGWGFHPKITLWNQQKTKFIIVKRAKDKNIVKLFIEYEMANASNFK